MQLNGLIDSCVMERWLLYVETISRSVSDIYAKKNFKMYRIYTVSYTHLDVYKRQILMSVRTLYDNGYSIILRQHKLLNYWRIGYDSMCISN